MTFVIDDIDEITFLYTCDAFSGEMEICDEGELVWIPEEQIGTLPIWPGDKLFFTLLSERSDVFSLKLHYVKDELVGAALDGKKIDFVV